MKCYLLVEAAAAAHSLGTPLSTIKIITQELSKQLKDQKDVSQDIELLSSQVERCNQILKRLTLNPIEEDEFIDEDLYMKDLLKEIILSFKETSKKDFILNLNNDLNPKKFQNRLKLFMD